MKQTYGYSLFTHSLFDKSKNKHFCRGRDCLKKFSANREKRSVTSDKDLRKEILKTKTLPNMQRIR